MKFDDPRVEIARMCHEVNRAICEASGDYSQKPWNEASDWQQQSAIKGVQFVWDNWDADSAAQHNAWWQDKISSGWTWGPKRDEGARTHPCMVPYDELPFEQRVKDHTFRAIVKSSKWEPVA